MYSTELQHLAKRQITVLKPQGMQHTLALTAQIPSSMARRGGLRRGRVKKETMRNQDPPETGHRPRDLQCENERSDAEAGDPAEHGVGRGERLWRFGDANTDRAIWVPTL